ncbi:MAG: ATP phosphoribosyltransferase regulatory subunit [Sandaracinus sp.]
MRDLVPPEAQRRRALGRALAEVFASFGYAPVSTPPFELESVMARAIEASDARELLRFVDAESGEVVMLRPDITPQIARVVASRLRDRPLPIRLSYEGHVVRRRRGRARTQRQIAQAGVECLGIAGAEADVEVVELASRALRAVGLVEHRIELNLPTLAGTLALALEPERREDAERALARKDRAELSRILAGAPAALRDGLLAALDLVGGREVIARARKIAKDGPARAGVDRLEGILRTLEGLDLGVEIQLDLGEPRGLGYYTGPSFAILAHGPGEPVASGGRYDELLARFGAPMPATGVAIDLDHVERALGTSGPIEEPPRSALLAGEVSPALAAAIRASGTAVATFPGATLAEARAHAAAWGHDAVAHVRGARAVVVRNDSEARVTVDALPSFLAASAPRSSGRARTKR